MDHFELLLVWFSGAVTAVNVVHKRLSVDGLHCIVVYIYIVNYDRTICRASLLQYRENKQIV